MAKMTGDLVRMPPQTHSTTLAPEREMETVLTNPFFLVFAFLTLSNATIAGSYYWYRARKAEIDAALKSEMLQRGMSADDIQKVLAAGRPWAKGTAGELPAPAADH